MRGAINAKANRIDFAVCLLIVCAGASAPSDDEVRREAADWKWEEILWAFAIEWAWRG